MKFFIKHFGLIFLFAIILSCSSDDDNDRNPQDPTDEYFIKANVDGEERVLNFENFMTAELGTFPINDLYKLVLSATRPGDSGQGNQESIGIDFSLDMPITVGVYNQPEDLPVGFMHAFLSYQNVDLSNEIGETIFVTDINNPVSSLEITELTENTVKGKFSGVVQNPLVEGDINITNGEFFLDLVVFNE